MPNWVKTNVFFKCNDEDFEEIIKKYKEEDRCFSFSKVFPAPDYIYQGPIGQEESKKYGDNNWYTWNCRNWGTKWNCAESWYDKSIHEISWETAWECARPLLKELSRQLPNIEIKVIYADEDLGINCEGFKLLNGETINSYHPEDRDDGGKEAFAFACKVWEYESPDEAWFDDGDNPCPVSYDDYFNILEKWNTPYECSNCAN